MLRRCLCCGLLARLMWWRVIVTTKLQMSWCALARTCFNYVMHRLWPSCGLFGRKRSCWPTSVYLLCLGSPHGDWTNRVAVHPIPFCNVVVDRHGAAAPHGFFRECSFESCQRACNDHNAKPRLIHVEHVQLQWGRESACCSLWPCSSDGSWICSSTWTVSSCVCLLSKSLFKASVNKNANQPKASSLIEPKQGSTML